MPDVASGVMVERGASNEIDIKRVLLGHSPAEVVYDCR